MINLDPAGGILKKNVTSSVDPLSRDKVRSEIKEILSRLYNHPKHRIVLGNNETCVLSHLLHSLKIKDAVLITTSHEYKGIVYMLQGKDVSNYITRPSSNLKEGVPTPRKFVKDTKIIHYVNLHSFKKYIHMYIKDINGPIILLISHVSRITGEIFPVEEIYNYIEMLNKTDRKNKGKIYMIVDGAQAVFTFKINPKNVSHIYLGTSSKALGADPTIGFAFFNLKNRNISDSKISSEKALLSFYNLLSEFEKNKEEMSKKLSNIKNRIINSLHQLGETPYIKSPTSPYIITIPHQGHKT